MTALRKVSVALALVAPFWVAGCSTLPVSGKTCLGLADDYASPDRIREGTASDVEGGKALCEGLAYLGEKKVVAARMRLETALKQARPEERWPIQGYLARAQALDQVGELALRNWTAAIAGAVQANDRIRETIFRADRGTYYAQHRQFDRALDDFALAYDKTENEAAKAQMAYTAFKVAVSMENLDRMRRWYPLAMAACEAVGDGDKMAYATEYYGQVLDAREDYTGSDAIYRQGIEAIRRTGNMQALADVLEFHGQSRFHAGDAEGGRESYGQSAALYGAGGHRDYEEFMQRNRRAMEARLAREQGYEP